MEWRLLMFHMNNKTRKIISAVIIVILILAMVLTMVVSVLV